MSCKAVIDGKNIVDEAIELLTEKYAPRTDVASEVRPAEMTCFYGDDVLLPWDGDKDKRPRSSYCPREGAVWPFEHGGGSALWGECTPCVKEARDKGTAINAARWRRINPHNPTYNRESLCDYHANKVASAPIEVPQFTDAEEALAWLDQMTEARTG